MNYTEYQFLKGFIWGNHYFKSRVSKGLEFLTMYENFRGASLITPFHQGVCAAIESAFGF